MATTKQKAPNYASWPKQKVSIADLFLDAENIRLGLDIKSSQDALIHDLFANEGAMDVLDNIAQNGLFPDELPVAIKHDAKFIVIEGNRRVAALKVMARPEIVAAKESYVRKILKSAAPLVKQVEVVVAPNREAAQQLLASKHTQNTRRPWRPLRQAYFYKAQLERGKTVKDLRDDYPTIDISKFLRLLNVHTIAKSLTYDSDQTAKKVHDERKFPASTLERLYEDKSVRKFLGFDFDGDGEVQVKISKKEFEKGFKKVVQDVVEKVVDSRALNNEKNRQKYLESFAKDEVPKKTKSAEALTSKDFEERPPVADKKRKKLAPRDIAFTLRAPGVRRMLVELQGIDYRKYPNAAHDLLRSFLECGLKSYFDHRGKPVKPASTNRYVFLDTVLQAFKSEMDAVKHTELSQVTQRVISSTNMRSYSAQFLNATNHNPSVFATPQDVEDAWDTLEKLFRYILDPK